MEYLRLMTKARYQHTDFSSKMSSAHSDTIKPFLLHEDETRWNSMGNLEFSIKTGKPSFDYLYSKDYFSYLKEHSLLSNRFNDAMRIISEKEEEIIAKNVSFTGTIVYIGGGTGQLINKINYYNNVEKSYLFDLPEVKEDFTAQNCIKLSGSFFDKIDINADTYILKRILHDWDNEKALLILKNVAKAMPLGATLLIFEGIIGKNNTKFLSAIDLLLLSIFGGKERDLSDFISLVENTGLEIRNINTMTDTMACIECIKI